MLFSRTRVYRVMVFLVVKKVFVWTSIDLILVVGNRIKINSRDFISVITV